MGANARGFPGVNPPGWLLIALIFENWLVLILLRKRTQTSLMVQSWADRKHNWNQCCWTDSFSFYWEQLVLASILWRCVNEHNYYLSQPCLWHFSLTSLLEENPSLSVSVFSFHITAPWKIHQEPMRGSIPHVTVGPRSHKTVRQGQNIDLSNHFIFPQRSLKLVVDQFLLITWLTAIDCIGVGYPGVPPRMWLFFYLYR